MTGERGKQVKEDQKTLTADEIDTIGEVFNISMGAAATAVSTMLERQVLITTPHTSLTQLLDVDFSALEPAIVVKINYIKGLSGTNIIVIRRRDMGVILDLLMGNDFTGSEEYEFDEMSMSAACEVMNQMMGASATAMSEMIHSPINISTPTALLVERSSEVHRIFEEMNQEETVVAISFKMSIKETLDTTFSCILPLSLSRTIVQAVNGEEEVPEPPLVQVAPPAAQSAPPPMQPTPPPVQPTPPPVQPTPPPVQPTPPPVQPTPPPVQPTPPPMQPTPPPAQPTPPPVQPTPPPVQPQSTWAPIPDAAQLPPDMQPGAYPYPPTYQQPYDPATPYMPYQQQPYPQQPYPRPYPGPYGQHPDPQNGRYLTPTLNVRQAEFPEFPPNPSAAPGFSSNMNLLMGVKLEVSVVIGRAKQKIKDVLELGQGSVIELDRQTGSPAEIVVNGQLLAYGDVVVVGDNFGIRITDIVGTRELIDSLEKNNK
jgi:flagellar motor switch protein FliN/FliY